MLEAGSRLSLKRPSCPGPCTLPAGDPRCFSSCSLSCSFFPSPFGALISPPWLVPGSFSPSSRNCHLPGNSECPVPMGTRHPISMVTCRNLRMPWDLEPLDVASPHRDPRWGSDGGVGKRRSQHLLGPNVDRGIHSCALPHSRFLPKAHH